MSRRIEVELTSERADGTWTWRAAGARQPKGVLDAELLYGGAKVGDVVRAEAEFELEGITITSIIPPKGKKKDEPSDRIELKGGAEFTPVTTQLAPKGRRDSGRGDRGDRGGPRGDRAGRGDRGARAGGPPGGRGGPPTGRGAPQGARGGPPAGRGAPQGGRGGPRPDRAESGRGQGGPRPQGGDRPTREDRRPKRLTAGTKHRDATVATLAPEQQAIAEQLLRGGIPAVRRALDEQNKSRPEGTPEIKADALIAEAEQLLPALRAAEWRDRAEAAKASLDDLSLRDLRSVVSGADLARDEEARLLASDLRAALDARLAKLQQEWVSGILSSLDEKKVIRALKASVRPPEGTSRVPADLATRLTEEASAALAPDTPAREWLAILEAAAASPVRRNVKPTGLPREDTELTAKAAAQHAGRVPALAKMLGIDMPPPPGPVRRPPPPPED